MALVGNINCLFPDLKSCSSTIALKVLLSGGLLLEGIFGSLENT